MTKSWSPERRLAQKERARKLYEEGRFGGPGRGQGRKPKRRLQLSMFCPHCGGSLEGLRLDTEGGNVRGSFYTRRAADGTLEIVDLGDDVGLGLGDDTDMFRIGQSVSVVNQRGVITGFSRDRNHVYIRFSKGARKVPVEEVTPVR
ncbi:hypothetical protein BH09ACT13_BH09ACT13_04970 [soil metagenome]